MVGPHVAIYTVYNARHLSYNRCDVFKIKHTAITVSFFNISLCYYREY